MTKIEQRIRSHPAVEDVSDERRQGDGIWLYLKTGWFNANLQCTVVHEPTWSACEDELKRYVRPSNGPEEE